MASKYRKITINVSNDELNALEAYLMFEMTKEEADKYRSLSLRIWNRLVGEWDKPKQPETKNLTRDLLNDIARDPRIINNN